MTYVTGKSYAFLAVLSIGLFLAFLLTGLGVGIVAISLPAGNIRDLGMIGAIPICPIGGLFILFWVWRTNSSFSMSFFEGMEIISDCLMSGCFPLTAIYIFPLLIVVFIIALFNTGVGLIKGKTYPQEQWIGLVNWFYKRRHGYSL